LKRTVYGILSLVLTAVLFLSSGLKSQSGPADSKPRETYLTLTYLCTSNDSVCLTANLKVYKKNGSLALMNATIDFSSGQDENFIPVGSAPTDQEGNASVKIAVGKLQRGKDRMIAYKATFAGSPKYYKNSAEFRAEPAKILISFSSVDTLHYINLTGSRNDLHGHEIPLSKEIVNLHVPRLFSLIKLGAVMLDEEGKASFKFPGNIVGDSLGNLTIIAGIEDNVQFGSVQAVSRINWGMPNEYRKSDVFSPRQLWTPSAPLWMIITLIVMLSGVWAHYMYAVWELIMIRRSSKKDKPIL